MCAADAAPANGSNGPTASIKEEIPPLKWPAEPETSASFLNRLVFYWMQPLFSRASFLRKKDKWLEMIDLAPLAGIDRTEEVEKLFEKAYNEYVPKKKKGQTTSETESDTPEQLEARLTHALLATCKARLLIAGVARFLNTVLQFTFPILLNLILTYFQDVQSGIITREDPPIVYYKGYWLSALLMMFVGCKAVTESAYFHLVNRCTWRVKTAVSSSIYRKSLRLASSEQQKTTLGEIVNLMQVDASKIEAFVLQIHVMWDGLFQISGYMVILGTLLGWTCLVGLLIIVFAIPIMGKITGKMYGLNRSMVKYTDDRVKTVNEGLQGMLCLKMYTWEESFAEQVEEYRKGELASLRKVANLRAFLRAYMSSLPQIAAAATFLTYVYAYEGTISAAILFSSIVAFDLIRMPLMFYPMALAQYVQCKVSLKRVGAFLGYGEVSSKGYTRNPDKDGEIIIENATFYWMDPNTPVPRSALKQESSLDGSSRSAGSSVKKQRSLKRLISSRSTSKSSDKESTEHPEDELVYPSAIMTDVNIKVQHGKLCAVVGPVGSGKSTLCSSILNEAVLGEGSNVVLNGNVAYVAQTAWILNKTVRDNILFGLPYDEERYNRVIDACSLRHDLKILEDGDMTEIGERGINLSGGQKQRIAVARAAYSDADVFIFDDPLSALDPEVAERVFDECIMDMLGSKTRLLVTNQLQCLSKCDTIIALSKHGKVLEQGSYEELIGDKRGEVTRLLAGISQSRRSVKAVVSDNKEKSSSKNEASTSNKDAKKLVTQEERMTGSVELKVSILSLTWNVYLKYIKAGGGYFLFGIVIILYLASAGVNLMSSLWLSAWTTDSSYLRNSETFYISGYALTALLMGFVTFIRTYGVTRFSIRSARRMHSDVLRSILRAPISFFDVTPTGRILSRFSKDIFTVDQELADIVDIFIYIVIQLCVVLITIIFVTPFFAIALPFLMILYFWAMNYYRQVARELKRLDSVSRSPVFAQFSETLGGLSTIRAFGRSNDFRQQFESILDANTQTVYANKVAERWLACRLEGVASLVVGFSAIFATHVVVSNGASIGDSNNFASLAGISLSYAVTATGMMQFVVRAFASVEAAMNSVERIAYYTEEIPHEAAHTSDELEWPQKGAITLTNLKMRYRPETPLVLKGVDVKIGAGERIGIVGRTGSGKSSMLLILMRLVEPYLSEEDMENYHAPVVIDELDCMRMGLFDLRSKIGIIPQSPVLFSGTIRSNMDPFNNYTDEEIWEALGKCTMKDAVEAMTDGLQSKVAEYGENLSQGQRQLLCLGRALLKHCHILLLDEATSSVDYETDKAIQTTIREAFKGCTVLTIAHRVNTIMDSDKILVMDNGHVAEFDSPEELLKDETSMFSDIVSHSNGDEIEE
ncbi:hypothetical protein ACHAXN_013106 [Cyclotella atomus]